MRGFRRCLKDTREAALLALGCLSRGSAPGPGRIWQLKTSDGQTLYVGKLSRQRSGTISDPTLEGSTRPGPVISQPESITQLLKQVADRITFASMNYRIWRICTEPGDRAKYVEVLRRYNSFFLTSLQAHFLATIVALYGLYEARSESISLGRAAGLTMSRGP